MQKKLPQKRAVALEYGSLDELPRITAAGVGETARYILELAKEHKVPIQENHELLQLLEEVKLGEVIDSRTFRLVAELITFLYTTEKEWRADHQFLAPVLEDTEAGNRMS